MFTHFTEILCKQNVSKPNPQFSSGMTNRVEVLTCFDYFNLQRSRLHTPPSQSLHRTPSAASTEDLCSSAVPRAYFPSNSWVTQACPRPRKNTHENATAAHLGPSILTPGEQGPHVCVPLPSSALAAAVVTRKYLLKCSEDVKFPLSKVKLMSLLSSTNSEQFHTSSNKGPPSPQIYGVPEAAEHTTFHLVTPNGAPNCVAEGREGHVTAWRNCAQGTPTTDVIPAPRSEGHAQLQLS